jgi:hypothetical protein
LTADIAASAAANAKSIHTDNVGTGLSPITVSVAEAGPPLGVPVAVPVGLVMWQRCVWRARNYRRQATGFARERASVVGPVRSFAERERLMRRFAVLLAVVLWALPAHPKNARNPCPRIPPALVPVSGDAQTMTMWADPTLKPVFQPLVVLSKQCNKPQVWTQIFFHCIDAESNAPVPCSKEGTALLTHFDGIATLNDVQFDRAGKFLVIADAGYARTQFSLTVVPPPVITVDPVPYGGFINGAGLNCGRAFTQDFPAKTDCSAGAPGPNFEIRAVSYFDQQFGDWTGVCAGQASTTCRVSAADGSVTSARFGSFSQTYQSRCSYRCCDSNNNCNVTFVMGYGCGSCNFASVCAKQGMPGWSPGGMDERNSSFSCESGCWRLFSPAADFRAVLVPCAGPGI